MHRLVFFRQKRYDGAVRTGVELDDELIAHRFSGGHADPDPALLWYVDLRCEGEGIPDGSDEAAHWLLEQAAVIQDGFCRFSEHIRAGLDPDIYSLNWTDFPDAPERVSLQIACSAVRRVDGRAMAAILSEIADNWLSIIRELDIPQEAEDTR